MYISRIELTGFKSFASRTRLDFFPGIIAIVGPNGCGKTNIVDAVRWVMGEQKGSTLRSERMEQIIFAGSSSKKPTGMAEVNLTMENNRGIIPTEYSEITISRRLYRDGTSDYLINRKKVRLKDIVDLFLDTGLGANSYSIIQPELVNQVLSNDDDRRVLFEEAAGIAKYKLRVRTAERRLIEVNDNLERLNDILTEVDKNVRTLKRQYKQASAYESLRKRLEQCEIGVIALDFYDLQQTLQKVEKRKKGYSDNLKVLQGRIEKQKNPRADITGNINSKSKDYEAVRKQWDDSRTETMQAESALLLLEEKERNAQSQKQRNEDNITRSNQQLKYLSERNEQLKSQCDSLEVETGLLQQQWEEAKSAYNEAEAVFAAQRDKLTEAEREISDNRRRLSEIDRRLASDSAQIKGWRENKDAVLSENENNRRRIKELEAESEDKSEYQGILNSEIGRLNEALKVIAADTESKKTAMKKLEEAESHNRLQYERLNSELNFLKALIEGGEGFRKGVSFLMKRGFPGIIDTIGNLLKVKPEYVKAIEAALGETAEYLTAADEQSALNAIEILRSESGGRATIAHLDYEFPNNCAAEIVDDRVIGPASDLVECGDKFKPLIDFILSQTLVVKTLQDAVDIRKIHRWRGSIVTLEGERLDSIGITGGKTSKKRHVVGGRQRLSELRERIREFDTAMKRLQNESDSIRRDIDENEEKKNGILDEIEQNKSELSLIERRNAALEGEINSIFQRIQSNNQRIALLDEKTADKLKEAEELKTEFEKVQRIIMSEESELSGLRSSFQSVSDELAVLREDAHRRELALSEKTGRLDKIKSEIKLGALRIDELKQEIEQINLFNAELDKRLEQMSADKKEVSGQIEKNRTLTRELTIQLEKLEQDLSVVKSGRDKIDENLKQLKKEADEFKESLSEEKIKSAGLDSKITGLLEAAMDKFGVDLSALEEKPESGRVELSAEADKLRRKLSSIGPVNLLALQEYGKEKERLDFLQSELKDIVESRESLQETISRTNSEARVRFRKALEAVRGNFQLLFTDLFDGGAGDIQLESGDPLDTNIILTANPAGKKLSSLDQLSSGEKTLTALALLFALYQLKPSPFCILDEVDAPLDDANVERFIKLIRRFIQQTQFVLVTHNKRTMEAADYLYGVTMEEEGVSKLISVKLAEQLEQAS